MSDDASIIKGLCVYAQSVYPVQLASGKRIRQDYRVDVRAQVDADTGEVRFYVDPGEIEKLR